jgi:hypothetical protein
MDKYMKKKLMSIQHTVRKRTLDNFRVVKIDSMRFLSHSDDDAKHL